MPKKSKQKFKYLENEKGFWDEIKSIFHHFLRAIIEAITIFLEGECPNWRRQKQQTDYLFL